MCLKFSCDIVGRSVVMSNINFEVDPPLRGVTTVGEYESGKKD